MFTRVPKLHVYCYCRAASYVYTSDISNGVLKCPTYRTFLRRDTIINSIQFHRILRTNKIFLICYFYTLLVRGLRRKGVRFEYGKSILSYRARTERRPPPSPPHAEIRIIFAQVDNRVRTMYGANSTSVRFCLRKSVRIPGKAMERIIAKF